MISGYRATIRSTMAHRGPWFWIGMGIITPVVLVAIAVVGIILYVLARQAPMMKEVATIHDPRLRLLRLAAAAHSELDVKVDEKAGTLTYTNKESGEWETVDYAEIGSGPTKTAPKIPAWVALYPEASHEFVFSTRAQKKDGTSAGAKFILTTSEPVSKVKEFYTESVRALGFKVERHLSTMALSS